MNSASLPRPLLYLADLLVVALVYFGLDAAAEALPLPDDFRLGIVVSTFAKCLFYLFIVFWLRVRGDTVAAIGLRRPRSWPRTVVLGVLLAAAIFLAIYLLERAGFRRDLSAFAAFHHNLPFTLWQLGGIIIGAGFGEEFLFRGFLFQRLALLFGGRKHGWAIACLLQAAFFGYMHAYQGPLGIVITGCMGLIFGLVFVAAGRNLWVTIFAHALYDSARLAAFYTNGAPPW